MTSTLTAPDTALDALRALAKPKKASKDAPPSFTIPEAIRAVRAWEEAKAAWVAADAALKAAKLDALNAVVPVHRTASRQRNEPLSSIRVNDVLFICQNRYKAIPADGPDDDGDEDPECLSDEAALRKADPDFERHFTEQMTITVDPRQLSPEQLQQLAAMSPTVTRTWKPNDRFHADRVLDDNVARIAEEHGIRPTQYFKQ